MRARPFLWIGLAAALLAGCGLLERGSRVSVARTPDGYELIVNGKPFYIRGAGVGEGFGRTGENYLALAKELGANTVRTWGTDQGTKRYLDEARRQGLYVFAGIWVNYADPDQGISYLVGGEAYRRAKEKEALDYVRRFKNHPAVIAWNVGNECLFFTKDGEERIALAKFLESLTAKIKKLDPHHPVVYASVNSLDLKLLKQYVPSLDLIGMNVYGSIIGAQSGWIALEFDKPYVITEFGPLGPWDLPQGPHGRVVELADTTKAQHYQIHWSLLLERRGNNVGGFAFHLGETTQESLTMWNINDGLLKKEPFVVLQKLYGAAREPLDHAPRIRSLDGVPAAVRPGERIKLRVDAADPEQTSLTYVYKASTATQGVLQYYVNEEVPLIVHGEGPSVVIEAPTKPGVYRLYVFVRDATGRSASRNHAIKVEG